MYSHGSVVAFEPDSSSRGSMIQGWGCFGCIDLCQLINWQRPTWAKCPASWNLCSSIIPECEQSSYFSNSLKHAHNDLTLNWTILTTTQFIMHCWAAACPQYLTTYSSRQKKVMQNSETLEHSKNLMSEVCELYLGLYTTWDIQIS